MRDERNAEMFDELKEKAKARMDLSQSLTDEEMREWLEALVFEYAQHEFLSMQQKKEAVDKLFYSFRGLDVLQPYLNDETVAEIMVNRHDEIFIEKQGEVFPVPDSFESEQKLEDIIQWIVGKVNRAVNESSPIVDARPAGRVKGSCRAASGIAERPYLNDSQIFEKSDGFSGTYSPGNVDRGSGGFYPPLGPREIQHFYQRRHRFRKDHVFKRLFPRYTAERKGDYD